MNDKLCETSNEFWFEAILEPLGSWGWIRLMDQKLEIWVW